MIGSGAALIDTTYVDNAADAIVAAADHAGELGGRALVVSNGQPRPVRELLDRIVTAAGLAPPRLRVPVAVARAAGTVLERAWDRLHREDDPPITSFLAEQLSTAHWFDQRETRRALGWQPAGGPRRGLRPIDVVVARPVRPDGSAALIGRTVRRACGSIRSATSSGAGMGETK